LRCASVLDAERGRPKGRKGSAMKILYESLLVAVLLTYFFGPARRLFLRRHAEITGAETGYSSTAVVLIHGTFATDAKWTQEDHLLVKRLRTQLGPCSIYRLRWSGDNYHSVRCDAVQRLCEWIAEQRGDTKILLIGHSHGGGIAAVAAARAQRAGLKIVTLSTPFINSAQRHASFLRRGRTVASIDDEFALQLGAVLCIWAIGTGCWVGLLVALGSALGVRAEAFKVAW
jgi:pimeloyl-ACP methyl ester carboxylesterase